MTQLTYDDVVKAVGRDRLDAEVIAKIVALGATPHDLLVALDRLTRDGEAGAETLHPIGPSARRIYDILAAEEEEWTERGVR